MRTHQWEFNNTEILLLHNALLEYTEAHQTNVSQETTAHRTRLLEKLSKIFSNAPTTFLLVHAGQAIHLCPDCTGELTERGIIWFCPHEAEQQLGEMSAPTLEEITARVNPNSFEIVLGRSLLTRELVVAHMLDAHLKIIGTSGKGKSCEAAAILAQLLRTHDRRHLLVALLDQAYEVSRLFEHDPHVLRLNLGQERIPCVGHDADEVAHHLGYLAKLMEYRYRLSEEELAAQPRMLIYVEEVLDLMRQLQGELCNKATDAFTALATRGLKVGLHLMVCTQVDSIDDDLKDAMNQFVGINLAFSVRPEVARAAGFMNYELLSKNYTTRVPGQFVIETTGSSDFAVAPQYDVKAKLQAQADERRMMR